MDNSSIGWARPPGSLMVHRRDGRSRIESKLITEVDVGIEMSGARDRRLRLGGMLSAQESTSMTAEQHWIDLRAAISSIIGDAQMARWFGQITADKVEDGVLRLHVESKFTLERIGNSFGSILEREAMKLGLESVRMQVIPVPHAASSTATGASSDALTRQPGLLELIQHRPSEAHPVDSGLVRRGPIWPSRSSETEALSSIERSPKGLRKDHTLDRFVVGQANRVAHAAALEVLRTPGISFNPLFLHGGSGLGKTHLLQAITRQFFIQGERSMRYVPAEYFVYQFVRALRQKNLQQFRRSFRELKVLAIDDIQAFVGKRSSQQELLETVDAIAQHGGQVLLACDVPPRKLDQLHQQLQNRFAAGLVVLVDAPDHPTRVSILRQEVLRGGVDVPEDVIQHIADAVRHSVRELLGTLVRVVAECELKGIQVSLQQTRAILEPIAATLKRRISIESIVERVAIRWGLPPEEILSRSRTRNTSMARNVATYLARILTDYSLVEIGEQLGSRSHSSVSSSCRKIQGLISTDAALRDQVEVLLRDLRC